MALILYLDHSLLIPYPLQIDRPVPSGGDIVVALRRSVIIGQKSIPEPGKDALDEVVDLGCGPMLHDVPDDDQIPCLIHISQALDNPVLPPPSRLPPDLLHHLKPNIGLMLEQDVLHHLPIPKPNLHDAPDLRPIDQMLKIEEVLQASTGVGTGT
jgi:hypothetical protein